MEKVKKPFLLHLILILSTVFHGTPVDWMSYGYFTSVQLDKIMNTVIDVLKTTSNNYAIDVSNAVAAYMAQTWYAMYIIKPNEVDHPYDAVCYGYAFRNRWLWVNNISPGKTIILWKDYNCVTAKSGIISDFYDDASNFKSNIGKLDIRKYTVFTGSLININYYENPWLLIYNLVQHLAPTKGTPKYAYSSIIVEAELNTIPSIILQYTYCYDKVVSSDCNALYQYPDTQWTYNQVWLIWQTRSQ